MHRLHTQVDWIQLFYPFLRDLSAECVLFVDDKHMDNTGIVLDHFVYCCLATRIIVLRASRLFVYQWNIFTPGVHCREEEVTVYHSGRIRLHPGFFFHRVCRGRLSPGQWHCVCRGVVCRTNIWALATRIHCGPPWLFFIGGISKIADVQARRVPRYELVDLLFFNS